MTTLNVLIGCEESQEIAAAFIALGHNAWSCDMYYPGAKGLPHYQCDVRDALGKQAWNIFIVHPVCKYMANSGNKHLYIDMKKTNGRYEPRWRKMEEAARFFLEMYNAPVDFVAAENPIMHPYAKSIIGVEQTQTIQPWMFGHMETKATCLWLRRLPPLVETNNVKAEMLNLPRNESNRVHYMPPGPDRERMRARTLPGIAQAMAMQWSSFVTKKYENYAKEVVSA